VIRATRVDDATSIAAFEAWSSDELASSIAQPATVGWVVEEHGRVVGHILTAAACDAGEVILLAVHPEHRRRGLARDLLGAAMSQWAERGVREAWLEVRADNEPAIALYRGLGWTDHGVRRRYYRDGTDARLLRWDR
jgi:ribosomal-protein-alanine N-acetyltransferase